MPCLVRALSNHILLLFTILVLIFLSYYNLVPKHIYKLAQSSTCQSIDFLYSPYQNLFHLYFIPPALASLLLSSLFS